MAEEVKGLKRLEKMKEAKWFPFLVTFLYFVAAFFITFLLYLFLFKSLGFYPFDETGLTTMMLDQRDQYIAYMRTYQVLLKNGGSFVYTLGKVFGGDFQSLFTYYLSSPFNLFVVFIGSNDIPAFFFFSSIVKMSFAAGNMTLLASYVSKNKTLGHLAFSIAYGFISYAFVYLSNFMYLDGLMILPFVTLGLTALEKGEKYWIYPLSLGYALLTNWYLGAMICIYSVLLFLIRISFMKEKIKNRIPFLLRFFIFSLIGGFLASFVWITAFAHFDGTKATLTLPSHSFFNWASFFEGFLENNYLSRSAISRNTGYMTMFVSVITLIFAQLYFTNKKFSWRDKIGDGLLLFTYFVVSLSSILNALFHGGREPTWFPTRYSFIIGFHVCYLANKEMSSLEETPVWGVAVPLGSTVILLPILCLAKKNELASGNTEILYPLSLISLLLFLIGSLLFLLYSFYLRYLKRTNKKNVFLRPIFDVCMIVLTAISSYRGGKAVVSVNIKDNSYQSYEVYRKDEELTPVFNNIKEFAGDSIYRMEATFNRPGGNNTIDNNPMFYSYNGLSHYSSTGKRDVSSYMRRIGFHRNGFWERYDAGSTAAINSFVGIKYIVDDFNDMSWEKPQFIYNESALNLYREISLEKEGVNDNYHYYQNEYALPLGFVTPSHSATFTSQGTKLDGYKNTYWYGHFDYQNEMFFQLSNSIKNADGSRKAIFHSIPVDNETLYGGASVKSVDEFGQKTYRLEKGSTIRITFVVPDEAKDNNLYLCEKNMVEGLSYQLDGRTIGINNYWNSGIHSFNAKEGTTHVLTITNTGKGVIEREIVPELYFEDLEVLKEYLTEIQKGGSFDLKETNSLSSTSFEGTFSYEHDQGEFLCTLPYENDFSIYVDDIEKPVLKRFDIFTAVSLDGLVNGKHKIKIVYRDKGLSSGVAVSIVSAAIIVPLVIFYPTLEKKLFKKKDDTIAD